MLGDLTHTLRYSLITFNIIVCCMLHHQAKHTTCGGLYVTWKFQFSRPLFTVRCLFMAPIHAPKWQRLTAFPFRFFNPFLLFLNLKFAFKRKPYYGRETLKCYSLFSHCLIGTYIGLYRMFVGNSLFEVKIFAACSFSMDFI